MATPVVLNPPRNRPANNGGTSRALVLLAACCGVFVGFGSVLIFTFGVFLKPLTAAFGWSRAEVSLAFTVTALTVAVCSPFIGRLLDRFPARRIILPCTAIYSVGFASLALLTHHLFHLVAVFFLLGIVGNGTTQLGYSRVVSAWFDASRGRALAAVMAGSATGAMVFPPLAQALISAYGWRSAYAILGGLIFVLGIPLTAAFLYEPAAEVHKEPAIIPERSAGSIWASVVSFPFLGLVAALLLFSLATNGLNAHWAALLTDHGLGAEEAAAVLSVAGFSTLLSRLSIGYLLDRFFAARIVALLFLICGAGFLLVVYGHTPGLAFAGAALVGVGLGGESDAVPYLLTRYFGLERFGELYGYTWSVYAVAGALGPLLMGAIFDRTGSYHFALIAFFWLVIVAALLFASLPKYKRTIAPISVQTQ